VKTVPSREIELARALVAGDRSALDEFAEVFGQKVFQYTWLMCGQREDAEEVSQDTLMRVFESFDQLKNPEAVKAWVFRIAKNYCLMKRRKSVFAPERELSLDELMPSSHSDGDTRKLEIADLAALPEDEMLRGELRSRLEEALRGLPEMYRSVVLLRDVEELSTSEAAEVLEVSEDVIKQRLHRGRLALRKSLDGYVAAAYAERNRS
jgi:RNA polymerase sigma-70 factor (ECF subfamily)